MVELVATLVVVTIGLILLLFLKPGLTRTQGGKLLAVIALFVLPVASLRAGFRLHFEETKTVPFCLSCHSMEVYGDSLLVADETYLPANHFQNGRVDRRTACFDCHTQYTIFGDLKAKMVGLKHLYVHYIGQTPDEIELYTPYLNRECTYCHTGGRRFEVLHDHDMASLANNEISCMECHGGRERVHDVENVPQAEKWIQDPQFRGLPTVRELLELKP